jgi:hypothetical protein
MRKRFRPKLTYSNVIASIALFAALSGVAVAAGLPKNSVGPKQLKKGAVTGAKIRKGAVTAGKLGPKSVVAGKLGPNAVTPGNIVNGGITTAKIGAGAVVASSIKNGVITTNKLANANVTTAKLAANAVGTSNLANDSVTVAKLGPEVLGTPSPLRAGQTLRGVFAVGGTAPAAEATLAHGGVSYQFPLSGNPPAATILKKGQTSANCPGIGSGSAPGATAGNLCVYLTEEANLDAITPLAAENNTRLGFGLVAKSAATKGDFTALGQWAVTAP